MNPKKCLIALVASAVCLVSVQPIAAEPAKKGSSKAEVSEKAKSADEKKVEAAKKITGDLTPTQEKKLLEILNEGDEKAITALPGLGESRAKALMKKRPIKDPAELILIDGIGEGTLKDIVAHMKGKKSSSTKKSSSSTTKK